MRHVALCVSTLLALSCSEEEPNQPAEGASGGSGALATGGSGGGGSGGRSASGGRSPAATGGSDSTGGTAPGSGGATSGGAGGANASGGAGGGAGGGTAGGASGTGGQGDGGFAGPDGSTPANAFCPPGSETATPDLSGSPEPVMGVPPSDGYNGFNLEGPVWLDGSLYLSEIHGDGSPPPSRIVRYTPGAGAEEFVTQAGTNGLAIDESGNLYGASHAVGGIVRFDRQRPDAPPQPVVREYGGSRLSSPNDLTLGEEGRIYFTDPFYQAGAERQAEARAYWVDSAKTVRPISGAPKPPNGISLSPDGETLYIGGEDPLMAFPIQPDGAPGAGRKFGAMDEEYRGVDGMGVDCAGNLYVTLHQQGMVVVLSPSGAKLGSFTVGQGVTNVAFGGANRTTLFITKLNGPTLYQVDVGIAGLPY